MLSINPVTKKEGQCFSVGRAATGIYLILEEEKKFSEKKEVVVPANICYAAVMPIIYAGLKPVFCDVDKFTGNATLDCIKEVVTNNTLAIIVPHMYGNPVLDLPNIKSFCEDNDVVLIEDCASLMALDGKAYIPGTIGDYVVYSTGYSKIIDIGFGGLVYSDNKDLTCLEKSEKNLRLDEGESEEFWGEFSKQYRKYRNTDQFSGEAQKYFRNLIKNGRDNLIFTISDEKKKQIIDSIKELPEVIEKRRRQCEAYKTKLSGLKENLYPMSEDAVPWRFSMLIENGRREFIIYCLNHSLPVSDWYPRVTPVFGNKLDYPGAKWHEEHIMNFPLMIEDDQIEHVCKTINKWR